MGAAGRVNQPSACLGTSIFTELEIVSIISRLSLEGPKY